MQDLISINVDWRNLPNGFPNFSEPDRTELEWQVDTYYNLLVGRYSDLVNFDPERFSVEDFDELPYVLSYDFNDKDLEFCLDHHRDREAIWRTLEDYEGPKDIVFYDPRISSPIPFLDVYRVSYVSFSDNQKE